MSRYKKYSSFIIILLILGLVSCQDAKTFVSNSSTAFATPTILANFGAPDSETEKNIAPAENPVLDSSSQADASKSEQVESIWDNDSGRSQPRHPADKSTNLRTGRRRSRIPQGTSPHFLKLGR